MQGTSGLRIRDDQYGHASECSASRIRRRSRQHPTEASALGGPMKDRLYRDGLRNAASSQLQELILLLLLLLRVPCLLLLRDRDLVACDVVVCDWPGRRGYIVKHAYIDLVETGRF